MSQLKVQESRLRRVAARHGYALRKSRRRDMNAADYGGYMLTSISSNAVILGGGDFAYSATLEDVEQFLRGK